MHVRHAAIDRLLGCFTRRFSAPADPSFCGEFSRNRQTERNRRLRQGFNDSAGPHIVLIWDFRRQPVEKR